MKKALSFILILMVIISTGCTSCRKSVYYNYDEMIEKVVKVEIVEVSNTKGDKTKVLKTLDESLIDDFLYDLCQIEFVVPWGRGSLGGTSFCVYYNDVEYEIINYSYNRINGVLTTCDREEFEALVNKYYP